MTVGDLDTLVPLRDKIDILVPVGGTTLEGFLSVPRNPQGIIVFSHGSGSSRHSMRNHFMAEQLQNRGMATLLMDLLTLPEERAEPTAQHPRFNVPLMADRLSTIVRWIRQHDTIGTLPVGLFGSSTGGSAALMTAAQNLKIVRAVVSRSGRPDLAQRYLKKVEAPTLLIVGSNDPKVLSLNEGALAHLNERSYLEIIPGATHNFEQKGTLEHVTNLAGLWFEKYLAE